MFGRHFDFKKEEDGVEWYRQGGLDKDPGVCAVAARITAEVLMKLRERKR